MPRPFRPTLLLVPLLLAEACNVYACRYETRFVSVRGTMTTGGANVLVESMGFRQYDPEQPVSNSLQWVARAEGLPSAPTSFVLVDDRDPTRTVVTISFQGSAVSVSAIGGAEIPAADRTSLFELLRGGHGRVILRLMSGATITTPLTVATLEDWHRPSCD